MYRKDFIEQQIEALGLVLARLLSGVLGLKQNVPADFDSVSQALQDQLGIGLDSLVAIPESEFIDTLLATGKFHSGNLEKLADLLLLIGERTPQKSKSCYQKSLAIYRYLDQADRVYSVRRNANIGNILSKINNL